MKHIVNMSFGIGSWAAGKLVARKHGVDDLILLFADTKYEDEDTYRWGREAAANIGGELVEIADGRTPWEVFFDERFLGNSQIDPCSKILKRQLIDRWLLDHFPVQSDVTCYVGLHWSESDRFSRWDKKEQCWRGVLHRFAANGWLVRAPLCEPPLIGYDDLHVWAKSEGMSEQWMYQAGFPHANCGGRCVKQGKNGWKRLYEIRRDRFIECRDKEQEFRRLIGRDDVSIMKETVNGVRVPLTLADFEKRLEGGFACNLLDIDNTVAGCNCFGD